MKTKKDKKKNKSKHHKKEKKKDKKKKEKKLEKALKAQRDEEKKKEKLVTKISSSSSSELEGECGPSIELMTKAMRPETKDEWDKRQSHIRRVLDPQTGRMRLIKGDGEVIEEMVSKERHQKINQDATKGDGMQFQLNTIGTANKTV